MTVYADLLFIVNLYIDALLLSAVRRFLRLPLTGKRLLLASVLGGVFGLSALLPALPGVVLFPLALLESLALCAAAFAPKPMTQLLKAVFFAVFVWRGAFRAFDGCGVFPADTRHFARKRRGVF